MHLLQDLRDIGVNAAMKVSGSLVIVQQRSLMFTIVSFSDLTVKVGFIFFFFFFASKQSYSIPVNSQIFHKVYEFELVL